MAVGTLVAPAGLMRGTSKTGGAHGRVTSTIDLDDTNDHLLSQPTSPLASSATSVPYSFPTEPTNAAAGTSTSVAASSTGADASDPSSAGASSGFASDLLLKPVMLAYVQKVSASIQAKSFQGGDSMESDFADEDELDQ